jgi:hypothetical protein
MYFNYLILIENRTSIIWFIEIAEMDHNQLHDIVLLDSGDIYNRLTQFLEEIQEHSDFLYSIE